jgi:hypothetical protein
VKITRDGALCPEGHGLELPQHKFGVAQRVERQRRMMLGSPMAVGELGVLLLKVAAVRQ